MFTIKQNKENEAYVKKADKKKKSILELMLKQIAEMASNGQLLSCESERRGERER